MKLVTRRGRASHGFLGGLSVKELAKRVWFEINDDRCLGRAAEAAFYLVLSLFPLLICILALLSLIPQGQKLLLGNLSLVVPADAMGVIRKWVHELLKTRSKGLFSVSLIFALWSASSGMTALMTMLNRAYEVKEGRSFIRARIVAIGLIFALGFLVLGGSVVFVFGDNALGWISSKVGMEAFRAPVWKVLSYTLGLLMLTVGISFLYSYAPNVKRPPKLLWAGSIFSVLAGIGVSSGFSVYLKIASMNATYGSLGAVVVLMLWLYLMTFILMIGGEINSEIEIAAGNRASPKEKAQEPV
jgi:membrane protein